MYDYPCSSKGFALAGSDVRKRMSVIVKRNDKIRLYCKGADNVVVEKLRQGQVEKSNGYFYSNITRASGSFLNSGKTFRDDFVLKWGHLFRVLAYWSQFVGRA